jgi:hypothetical protein
MEEANTPTAEIRPVLVEASKCSAPSLLLHRSVCYGVAYSSIGRNVSLK